MSKQLKSKITLQDFGKAMSQLNLEEIPPHRRRAAVMDHFMKIQQNEIHDQQVASEIAFSRMLNAKKIDLS